MEFGKLSDLHGVSFDLPARDPRTLPFLQGLGASSAECEFYLGAPAWGHKTWTGKIYPAGAKTTEFLHYYARSFNCIELNTSHYRIPTADQVSKWLEQVTPGFKFCPKIVQTISHAENGLLDRRTVREWWESLALFGDHLGPCFLQLPPYFDYSRKASLFQFLQNWPAEFPLAIELRNPSWFREGHLLPALTDYLQGRRIGTVITDTGGRRDVLHSTVSAGFTLIRFVGNSLHASDTRRIHDWTTRLLEWKAAGLRQAYFMVHQPDDELAPETAQLVVDDWIQAGLTQLPRIHFHEPSFPI